jgi:hypothetical protein
MAASLVEPSMPPTAPPLSDSDLPVDPASAATSERARRRASWGALAALTAAVGAAHLVLLGAVPLNGGTAPSPVTARFVVRTIEAPPAPDAVPAAAPVAEVPRPAVAAPSREPARKAPTPPPRVRTPAPAAPAPAPPPTPSVAMPAPSAPAPEATPSPDAPVAVIAAAPVPGATSPDDAAPIAPDAAMPPSASDVPVDASATPATTTAPAPALAAPTGTPASGPPPPAAPAASSGPTPETAPLRVPASVRLKFAVTGQQGAVPLQGVFGELAWTQDGGAYDAHLTLRFLFKTLRTQHSSGVIGPTGIEPLRFSDTRKTEMASHFVRDRGEVVFSNNAPSAALLPGAQDRLSVMLQLGALLAGDPARYPQDGAIAVQTVGSRDADIWLFKVGPEETLVLPMGEIAARRLTRNARQPFDDTVELWLAPALGHLPVRIRLTQPNGDFADMQLREVPPSALAR